MREIITIKPEAVADTAPSPFVDVTIEDKPQARAVKKWKATIYENYSQLEAIWRRMESEGYCTPFQSYDWVSCWYDSVLFYSEAEPLIVTVSENGASPVWILPLCIYEKKGIWIISFADMGYSDYTAPVMAREAPSDEITIRAMINAVIKALPPCDLIHFQKLVERVDGVPNPLLLLRGKKLFPAGCYGIRLRQPWPELSEKITQSRLRAIIRQQKKKIRRRGEVKVEHYDTAETLAPVLDHLLAARDARFEMTGRPCMPPLWRHFYHMLSTRKNKTIKPGISVLKVGDEMVAACFGFTRGNSYYALLPTISMGKWERFRPGMLLFDAMLTEFAEKTNYDGYFDFTVGDEVYKKRFGCESRYLYEWMLPCSLSGFLTFFIWRLKVILRRYPKARELLKKIISRARRIKSKQSGSPADRSQPGTMVSACVLKNSGGLEER